MDHNKTITRRYSGEIRIYCRLDRNDNWVMSMNTRDGRKVITVGNDNWVAQGNAVDTPAAWDEAARCALSFAYAEDEENPKTAINVGEFASYNDDGNFHIARDFNQAWYTNKDVPIR